jgi:hypothetical protein
MDTLARVEKQMDHSDQALVELLDTQAMEKDKRKEGDPQEWVVD